VVIASWLASRMGGVLAHGGGQFLHRCGGFLQVRCLALAALGQRAVAGSDLAGGGTDRGRALLDAADHARQLAGGGVGIALDGSEGAVILAVHAPIQIAVGQRREHLPHFVDGAAQRIQQLVDATGQAIEEAGAFGACRRWSRSPAAAAGDGILQRELMGAVMPPRRSPGARPVRRTPV
jgi:hypothetical protein